MQRYDKYFILQIFSGQDARFYLRKTKKTAMIMQKKAAR